MLLFSRKGVIKTIPLDIPINFFFGSLFSILYRGRLKQGGEREFFVPIVWAVVYAGWFGATTAMFYAKYPDWMWSYILDSSKISPHLVYPFFWLALILSASAGAFISARMIMKDRLLYSCLIAGATLVVYAAVMALFFNEYFYIGTLAEFRSGALRKFTEFPEKVAEFNLASILMFPPLIAIAAYLFLKGRRRIHSPI